MTAPAETRDMALAAMIEIDAFDMAPMSAHDPKQIVGFSHPAPHDAGADGCAECRSLRSTVSEVAGNKAAKNEEWARHWLFRLATEGMADADPHTAARAYLAEVQAAHGVQLIDGDAV